MKEFTRGRVIAPCRRWRAGENVLILFVGPGSQASRTFHALSPSLDLFDARNPFGLSNFFSFFVFFFHLLCPLLSRLMARALLTVFPSSLPMWLMRVDARKTVDLSRTWSEEKDTELSFMELVVVEKVRRTLELSGMLPSKIPCLNRPRNHKVNAGGDVAMEHEPVYIACNRVLNFRWYDFLRPSDSFCVFRVRVNC